MRQPNLCEAMKSTVLPFVLQHHDEWRRRGRCESAPRLRVEAYDGAGNPEPRQNSGVVLDTFLAPNLADFTRDNVRLLFDDPNDGGRRDPPFDYQDPDVLRRLTLRVFQEWVDETVPLLLDSPDPVHAFDRLYEEFESAFFSEEYVRSWFSVLSKLAMHREVALEDNLVIRYLTPLEQDELAEQWRHLREGPPPQLALVQTVRVRKGQRIDDLDGWVLPGQAREKAVFCMRVLCPGGVYSDQLAAARRTCWRFDVPESTFFRRALTAEGALNTVLDEHDIENLPTLWRAIRDSQEFSLRFLVTKVDDACRRASVLDRFADVAVALQNIFGSEGERFGSALAWALRGHRGAEARKEMYQFAREINRRRNAVLHGNSARIREFLENLQQFSEFTDRAEHCLRQALQLVLLNREFRERLSDAVLGVPVEYRRLPFTF